MKNFLLLKTDLFLAEQPDEDLDCWSLGGDCIGWFYARLLPVSGVEPGRDPAMGDWNGWSCSVKAGGVEVELLCWPFLPIDDHWLFGLQPPNRLFKWSLPEELSPALETVAQALEDIARSIPGDPTFKWFAENPWDLKAEEIAF